MMKEKHSSYWMYGFCLIFLGLISGCSALKSVYGASISLVGLDRKIPLKAIYLSSTADANRHSSTAIDIVFVYQDNLDKTLKKMSGPQWFRERDSLMLQFDKEVVVAHFEVVPLTATNSVNLPKDFRKAGRVLLFANYVAKSGQFVADITEYQSLVISLEKEQYRLSEYSDKTGESSQ